MQSFNPVRETLKSVARMAVAFLLMAVALKVYGILGVAVIVLVAPVVALAGMAGARIERVVRPTVKVVAPRRTECFQSGGWHAGLRVR
jgi:hypothetical protein